MTWLLRFLFVMLCICLIASIAGLSAALLGSIAVALYCFKFIGLIGGSVLLTMMITLILIV